MSPKSNFFRGRYIEEISPDFRNAPKLRHNCFILAAVSL